MNQEGTYHGYLQNGVVTTSKGTGAEQMAVQFEITMLAVDGDWKPLSAPIKTTLYMSFSDAAWPFTEAKLKHLGFNGNFDDPDFSDEAKTEGVDLNCRHEEYNGKMSEKFELANFGGGPKKLEDKSAINRLQQRWNASNGKKPTGKPAAPPPRAAKAKTEQDKEHEAAAAAAPF
jgi:hypothetical protein